MKTICKIVGVAVLGVAIGEIVWQIICKIANKKEYVETKNK